MASVYKKTTKGQTEIETRANRLAPRLRSSLILVDGKRSADDLRPLIQSEPDQVLATLLEEGYIEIVVSTPAAATAPETSEEAAPPARKLDETKRMAVRFLSEHLGPSAETLAMKIERAHTAAELKPQLEMAEHFLRAGRGPAVAQEFAEKFLEP